MWRPGGYIYNRSAHASRLDTQCSYLWTPMHSSAGARRAQTRCRHHLTIPMPGISRHYACISSCSPRHNTIRKGAPCSPGEVLRKTTKGYWITYACQGAGPPGSKPVPRPASVTSELTGTVGPSKPGSLLMLMCPCLRSACA